MLNKKEKNGGIVKNDKLGREREGEGYR